MLRLQREQITTKLSMVVDPPCDSAILCPAWKSKTVTKLEHQVVLHFPWYSLPISRSQICSLTAFGIFCFLYLVGSILNIRASLNLGHRVTGRKTTISGNRSAHDFSQTSGSSAGHWNPRSVIKIYTQSDGLRFILII